MQKKGLIIGIIVASALLCIGIAVGGILAYFRFMSGKVVGKMPGNMSMVTLQDFTAEPIYKIGNHIYYSDTLFDRKNAGGEERRQIKEYLEKADATLSEDVLVNWYSEDTLNNNLMKISAAQYVDGVVCTQVYYATDTNTRTDPNIRNVSDFPPVQNLDTSNLLDPKDLFEDVKSHAKAHTGEMLMDQGKDKIYGTYQVEYDIPTDTIEYHFTVNTYSNIYVNAKTGRIAKEYYWDGNYVD